MAVCEDILTELMSKPITKIIWEPGQGDTNNLESELAEKASKIKTTEDIVEKRYKYGFLFIALR